MAKLHLACVERDADSAKRRFATPANVKEEFLACATSNHDLPKMLVDAGARDTRRHCPKRDVIDLLPT